MVINIANINDEFREDEQLTKDSKEEKNNESRDKKIVQQLFDDVKMMASKDFAKFSTILAAFFSIGIWLIKSIWYAYMSGKFAVYRIDKCYIDANNDNVFLQTIQTVSIFTVWFLINYFYYKISIAEEKGNKKKIKNILLFWMVEIGISFFYIMVTTYSEIQDLKTDNVFVNIIVVLLLSCVLCLFINIFAIEFLIEKKWKARKNKNKEKNINSEEKRLINMIIPVIATIAIELLIVYIMSYRAEYDRNGSKVIIYNDVYNREYKVAFEDDKSNKMNTVYPIVFENEDCYIVTRLYNRNGETKIDYNYQRVLEKNGQETIYIQNIYDIDLMYNAVE